MKDIKLYIGIVFGILMLFSCDILSISEDGSGSQANNTLFIDEVDYLNSNNYNSNLKLEATNLKEEYVLCADGEVLGIVHPFYTLNTRVEIDVDKLVDLWLIKKNDIVDEDDVNIDNVSFSWTVKMYTKYQQIKWTPTNGNINATGFVRFAPSTEMDTRWDFVKAYLNNDETVEVLAVLTPSDCLGTPIELNFGRNLITWTYFQSDSNGNNAPVELGSAVQDIVLTEDNNYRTLILPNIEVVETWRVSLLFENFEDYTVRLTLNGSPIEDSLSSQIQGSSFVEGNSYRSYLDLKVERHNVLTLNNDSGEVVKLSFDSEEGSDLFLSYTEGEITSFDDVSNREDHEDDSNLYLDEYYSISLY